MNLNFVLDPEEEIFRQYQQICQEEDRSKLVLDQNPLNMEKNRYPDVLVIKETAVKLGEICGLQGSDYINANFVEDKSNPVRFRQKYICCQAPLSSTMNDFWRMIWEYKVPVIVMITNLIEKNRVKADTYWPTEVKGVSCYGGIFVKLVSEKKVSDLKIRILKIWKVQYQPKGSASDEYSREDENSHTGSYKSGEEDEQEIEDDDEDDDESDIEPNEHQEVRQVVHLHCTSWPDFGVPKSTTLMTDLIAEVDIRKKAHHRPIVVHCSAGIGRTGTFVAIHMSLQKDLVGEKIDIKDTVSSLRSQRLGMVQSKEQYLFVYSVVYDILKSRYSRCLSPDPTTHAGLCESQALPLTQEENRRPFSRRATIQSRDDQSHATPTRLNVEHQQPKLLVPDTHKRARGRSGYVKGETTSGAWTSRGEKTSGFSSPIFPETVLNKLSAINNTITHSDPHPRTANRPDPDADTNLTNSDPHPKSSTSSTSVDDLPSLSFSTDFYPTSDADRSTNTDNKQ
eukprot:TRINITY_DN16688_c0_g1_i1.p1 TRINITY_DN16688_c0_g1~~TRINITY_DN16688_c0_g1_i1.p1  ORF type:complete len:510 (-),score=113.29 TRINITY_DN16688_c0_g1_i1:56-1585(-)